jgi:hypothetical protein
MGSRARGNDMRTIVSWYVHCYIPWSFRPIPTPTTSFSHRPCLEPSTGGTLTRVLAIYFSYLQSRIYTESILWNKSLPGLAEAPNVSWLSQLGFGWDQTSPSSLTTRRSPPALGLRSLLYSLAEIWGPGWDFASLMDSSRRQKAIDASSSLTPHLLVPDPVRDNTEVGARMFESPHVGLELVRSALLPKTLCDVRKQEVGTCLMIMVRLVVCVPLALEVCVR